jgi:hypothetical protein
MPSIKSHYLIFLTVLCFSLSVAGCNLMGGQSKKPESVEQKPQAPVALEGMLKSIEGVIAEVAQKSKIQGMSSLQRSAKVEPGNDSGQKGSGGENQPQQPRQGEGQSGDAASENLTPGMDWEKEEEELRKLHRHWNKLEPQAIKAGLGSDERDRLEDNLNQLTRYIGDKNIEESIIAATSLYMNYADISQVFSTDIPPEYYRTKFEIMSAIIKSGTADWPAASNHAKKAQERWDSFKNQLKEKPEELMSQCEFAIQDLNHAVSIEDFDLVMIKGEVLMGVLQELEAKMS